MVKTDMQLLRDALAKTTDLITIALSKKGGMTLLGGDVEIVEKVARRVLAWTAPDKSDCQHEPDWHTARADSDGDEDYVDVSCLKCNTSGCIGTVETLTDRICWEDQERGL